jgi:hypothetical protein
MDSPVLVFDLRRKLLLSNSKGRTMLLGQKRNEILKKITDFIQKGDSRILEFEGRKVSLAAFPLFDEAQTQMGTIVRVEDFDDSPQE